MTTITINTQKRTIEMNKTMLKAYVRIRRRPTTNVDIPTILYKRYPAFANEFMNPNKFARICGSSRQTI